MEKTPAEQVLDSLFPVPDVSVARDDNAEFTYTAATLYEQVGSDLLKTSALSPFLRAVCEALVTRGGYPVSADQWRSNPDSRGALVYLIPSKLNALTRALREAPATSGELNGLSQHSDQFYSAVGKAAKQLRERRA